jgi:hypothetical protein
MIVFLDLTEVEFQRYKRKYPILKSISNHKPSQYYFETQNPYISNGFGLCIGLPPELEDYVIYDDQEEDEASE